MLQQGHDSTITSMSFSATGRLLASGSAEGAVKIWDTELGLLRGELGGFQKVEVLAFSPDDRTLVIAGEAIDGSSAIDLWDTELGHLRASPRNVGFVTDIAFGPGHDQVTAASSGDGLLRLSIATGEFSRIRRRRPRGGAIAIELSSRGRHALTSHWKGTATLWDVGDGRPLEEFRIPAVRGCVRWIPARDEFFVCEQAGRTRGEWNTLSRWQGHALPVFMGHGIHLDNGGASYDVSERSVVTLDYDGNLQLWDLATNGLVTSLAVEAYSTADEEPQHVSDFISFSPDGESVAASCTEGAVLWKPASGEWVHLAGSRGPVVSAVFSPDGRGLSAVNEDRSITLWDVEQLRARTTFESGSGSVEAIAVDARGAQLLVTSGEYDRSTETGATTRQWDLQALALQADHGEMDPGSEGFWTSRSVAFTSEGQPILAQLSQEDEVIKIRNLETDRAKLVSGDDVHELLLDPQGQRLWTAALVREESMIWELGTGRPHATLAMPPRVYMGNLHAFSPEGSRAAASHLTSCPDGRKGLRHRACVSRHPGWDGALVVWDVDTGSPVVRWREWVEHA